MVTLKHIGAALACFIFAIAVWFISLLIVGISSNIWYDETNELHQKIYAFSMLLGPAWVSALSTFLLCKKWTPLKELIGAFKGGNSAASVGAQKNTPALDKPQDIPSSSKKQLELAEEILANIELCLGLANNTDRVSGFVSWYDEATDGFVTLSKLNRVSLSSSPDYNYRKLKDEFQWHLCDAIVRSKEKALSDIRGKYRNSREFQERTAKAFKQDIADVQHRFSEDTAELSRCAVDEVLIAAHLDVRDPIKEGLSIAPSVFTEYGGVDAELLTIDLMEGLAFEHWCAQLLRDLGYSEVSVTQGSGDQGVDVLAQKDGIKYAIQCKCYSSDLGNTPVQEINAGKTIYHCHVGVVMSNRHFTAGAKEAADATGVLLWDRDWITNAITKRNHLIQPHSSLQCNNRNTSSESTNICEKELLIAAVDVILETGQASVSMLQRRLKLGYARAARIVDEMEEKGIVGPFQGSKPRAILVTKEQWEFMKSGEPSQMDFDDLEGVPEEID